MPVSAPEHGLHATPTLDEAARQDFVSVLRGLVLRDMAADLRAAYEADIAPAIRAETGADPKTPSEVHNAFRDHETFKFYSAMRVNAQEMVWDSVHEPVSRHLDDINAKVREAMAHGKGTLSLDPEMEVPRSVSAIDVHLMPGNYDTEYGPDDAAQGAIMDSGGSVFSMGLTGRNKDDIASSIARYIAARYPDFQPQRILDLGCTLGNNTLPWARTYPQAEVHAIDVAAPVLRFAMARQQALGGEVHFHQMDATALDFPDDHFDLVWSSMFLHEVPLKGIKAALKEARRVLRPGGLMLHMELPPNQATSVYDGFYLDWDSWYNYEPYYKIFRDQDARALCAEAGFDPERYEEHVVPSLANQGEDAVLQAARAGGALDRDTGKLEGGISWYCFGAWA